jgi:hypothetical protein
VSTNGELLRLSLTQIVKSYTRVRKHCRQIKLLHVCALFLALVCAMKAAGQAFAPANTSTESKNNPSAELRTGTRQYPYANRERTSGESHEQGEKV